MFKNSLYKCPVCNRPTVLIERLRSFQPNPKILAMELKIPASYVVLVYEGKYLTTDREINDLIFRLNDYGCFNPSWYLSGEGEPYSSLKRLTEKERFVIRRYAQHEFAQSMLRHGKYDDEDVDYDPPGITDDYGGDLGRD